MEKNKNSAINEMLMLGVGILIIGLILASYSISSYVELKNLNEKIDFEMIDNNNKLSVVEKYYKYTAISEFLTKKLNKNKNIPVKNAACIYLDYAQHNALALYNLTNKKQPFDASKKSLATANIRSLYSIYDNYKTCRHQAAYKAELGEIIKEMDNADNTGDSEDRMNNFLNGYSKRNAEEKAQEQQEEYYTEELTPEQYEQLMQEQQILQSQEPEPNQTSVQIPPEDVR